MTTEREIIRKTEKMIDELKSVCSTYGLGNASSEYKIITEIFLYKYLNDKFIYETKKVTKELNENSTTKEVEKYLDSLSPEQFSILTMRMGANVAKIQNAYRVSTLFNNQNSTIPEFYELFDNALIGISNDNVDIFSVKTGSKEKIKLFDTLSQYITESDKRNAFFRAMISKLVEFSFENAFSEKYDFFSTIFEYLIKDYNKDFGKYAEYYTPNSIARIIAKILAPNPTQNVTLYDPAAGSGTLLLALAHQIGEENCTIYSQDISQKSNEFLRLNLILNNLVHSLGNVIHGDTLLNPAHLNKEKNGLAQFDYIVSNPPFKTDFSETREQLADDKYKDRFFAGVPTVPKKDKDKMPIYLLFIQHILFSLKANGKAAIVVPTGFLTAKTGIENKIKKEMIKRKVLSKVISMPSNIFANTGTNVSILFLDNSANNDKVFLMDASNMGHSEKDGKVKKTVLNPDEINKISKMLINNEVSENISVLVSNEMIESFNYDFSATLYSPIYYKKRFMDEEYLNNNIMEFCFSLNNDVSVLTEDVKEYMKYINKFSYINRNLINDLTVLEIPDGWSKVRLSKIIKSFEKGRIPKKIYSEPREDRLEYLVIENLNGLSNQFVDKNDGIKVNNEVVMVMDGAASGSVYQGKSGILGSTLAKIIISDKYNISNELLYFVLKSLEKEISKRNTGSTVPHANKIFIDNIYIAIPDNSRELDLLNNYFAKIRKIMLESEQILNNIKNQNELIYLSILNGQIKIGD